MIHILAFTVCHIFVHFRKSRPRLQLYRHIIRPNLKNRLKDELPRISEEIRVYEEKLAEGKLNPNPTPGPQFNG